jgi:hypothetical protein
MTKPLLPRLQLTLALLSFPTIFLYWQIYYPILRYNYLHSLTSMETAHRFASLLPFLPHLITLALIILTPGARIPRKSKQISVILLICSFFLFLVVYNLHDPYYAVRRYMPSLSHAHMIARDFELHAKDPDYPRTAYFNDHFKSFTDLAADLPLSAATHPNADEIIIALDTLEVPSLGLVFYHNSFKQWLYLHNSKAVALANGHATFIPTSELPAKLARADALKKSLPPNPRN